MFKNVSLTILLRLSSAVTALLSVPILLRLLGVSDYGVWAALTSVIGWVLLFDFGAGVTVKNSVSRTLANGDFNSLQDEVIQTLRFLFVISGCALLLFLLGIYFFDFLRDNWFVAFILIVPIIIVFPFTLGSMILQGARRFYLNSSIALIPQVLFLCFVYLYSLNEQETDIVALAIIYAFLSVCSVSVIWFLAKKEISLQNISLSRIFSGRIYMPRLKTSLRFFVLQVSSIFLYSMGTVVTLSNLGSADAAQYDIINKVYLFGMTLFNVVVSVFWSEIVFYIEKRDKKKLLNLYVCFVFLSIIFAISVFVFSIFSPKIISLWTSGKVVVDFRVTMVFAAVISIQAITYCGAAVMNSFEELTTQIYLSLTAIVFMLPASYYFFSVGFGITSFPLATFIMSIPGLFYCNYKAISLINGIKHA